MTFEERYIFWDGWVNKKQDEQRESVVSPEAAPQDSALMADIYNGKLAPNPIAPASSGIVGSNEVPKCESGRDTIGKLDTPNPPVSVDIVSVDEWFAPFRDVAAIKLRLGNIERIKSLMLRVYACPPADPPGQEELIHQAVILGNNNILRLQKTDASVGENKDLKNHRQVCYSGQNQKPARCLTHCRIEVFVSKDEHDLWQKYRGTRIPSDYNANIHDKSQPRPDSTYPDTSDQLGRNVTLVGCDLIERIMAGETQITIFDREPTDLFSNKDKPPKASSSRRVYTMFRAVIRHTMYQICQHTKIGMALLEQVANGPHAVRIYPVSPEMYHSVGGAGVNPAKGVRHDADYEDIVGKLIMMFTTASRATNKEAFLQCIKDKRLAELADKMIEADSSLPPPDQLKLDAYYKFYKRKYTSDVPLPPSEKAPAAPKTTKVDFLTRRTVLEYLGGSTPGTGCDSNYYFNVAFVRQSFQDGEYACACHVDEPGAKEMTFKGRKWKVVPAAVGLDGADKVIVETPLFVAFAHELVHARRFQLGLAAEYDAIPAGPPKPADWHPDAFIAAVKKLNDEPLLKNIASRYEGYNREEYDAVEGAGVSVTLPKAVYSELEGKGVIRAEDKGAAPNEIFANENMFRRELGLPMRRRYVEGETDRNTALSGQPLADAKKRKFGPCKNAPYKSLKDPKRPGADQTVLDDITKLGNDLLAEINVTSKSVPKWQRDVNYFVADQDHAAVALFYGYSVKSPEEKKVFCNGIVGQITDPVADMIADPSCKQALKSVIAAPLTNNRLQALRILAAIFKCDENDLATLRGVSNQLADAYKASNVDAFAAYVTDPDQNPVDIAHADVGVTRDPCDVYGLKPAAYLHGKYPNEMPAKNWYHTLIHEPMHVLAAWGTGFNDWKWVSEEVNAQTGANFKVVARTVRTDFPDNILPAALDPVDDLIKQINKIEVTAQESRDPQKPDPKQLGALGYRRFTKSVEQMSSNIQSNITGFREAAKALKDAEFKVGVAQLPASSDPQPQQGSDPQPSLEQLEQERDQAQRASDEARKKAVASANGFLATLRNGRTLFSDMPRETADAFASAYTPAPDYTVTVEPDKSGDSFAVNQMAWTTGRENEVKSAMDEGTTELFARIVLYRLNAKYANETAEVTKLAGIPYYEYPAHVCCQIVRDLNAAGKNGLELLGRAIFLNEHKAFNAALEELRKAGTCGKRYTNGFWEAVSYLPIDNSKYASDPAPVQSGVIPLRDVYGIAWVTPTELLRAIAAGAYHDPVCCLYKAGASGAEYEYKPVDNALKGVCCAGYPPPPLVESMEPTPVELKCASCKKDVTLPGRDILKR